MDARQEKGRTLSNDRRIRKVEGATWAVPSHVWWVPIEHVAGMQESK